MNYICSYMRDILRASQGVFNRKKNDLFHDGNIQDKFLINATQIEETFLYHKNVIR